MDGTWYGIHLIVDHLRFQIAASIFIVGAPDDVQIDRLLNSLLPNILPLVGESVYWAIRFLQ